jgi:hypothetical protein
MPRPPAGRQRGHRSRLLACHDPVAGVGLPGPVNKAAHQLAADEGVQAGVIRPRPETERTPVVSHESCPTKCPTTRAFGCSPESTATAITAAQGAADRLMSCSSSPLNELITLRSAPSLAEPWTESPASRAMRCFRTALEFISAFGLVSVTNSMDAAIWTW